MTEDDVSDLHRERKCGGRRTFHLKPSFLSDLSS